MSQDENLVSIKRNDFEEVCKIIENLKQRLQELQENKAKEDRKFQDELRTKIRSSWNSQGHKVNTEDADLRKLIQCQVLNEASETLQKTLQEEVKKIQVKQSKSHTEFKKAITEGQDTLEGMYSRCLADAFKSEGIAMLPNTVSELFIKSYNKAVEEVLIPEMNNILVVECRRIDVALTNASQSVTRGLQGNSQRSASPQIQQKLLTINSKLQTLLADNENFSRSANVLLDRAIGAARNTPTQLTPEQRIDSFVQQEDYHSAINQALHSNDLSLVLATCRRVPIERMFNPKPEQLIILSLISQLIVGLQNDEDLDMKIKFLLESVKAIDPREQCIQRYGTQQLNKLKVTLGGLPQELDDIRTLIWAVDMRLPQIQQ